LIGRFAGIAVAGVPNLKNTGVSGLGPNPGLA